MNGRSLVGQALPDIRRNRQALPALRRKRQAERPGHRLSRFLALSAILVATVGGLADARRIERVEVSWPGSRAHRVYMAELGELHTLDERAGALQDQPPTRPRQL